MSSFKIPKNCCSHPDYPLMTHVNNIKDSFENSSHKEASMFHDLGKLNKKFQNNINNGGILPFHALEGAFYFLAYKNLSIDIESFEIFLSILKHHGNLEDIDALVEELSDEDSISRNHPDLFDTIDHIQEFTNTDIDFDLEECCEIFDTESFVNDHRISGLSTFFRIKEVFSKLIFSDKYEAIFKKRFINDDDFETENYLFKLLKYIDCRKNNMSSVRNSARADVINNFEQNIDKSIFFIEAPTGIGKTFTALHLALKIANDKKKRRIINSLPMTSIIDQTHSEYSKVINIKELLKFHHLTKTKDYISKEKEEYYRQKNDFISSSWCMDQVIVTTFNQILNAFYSNRNRDLVKFWTIRDSVVIFDEIQAIPRILIKDFAKTILFLSKEFNIDFILMSATIPAIKRFLPDDHFSELLDLKYFSMDFNDRYSLKFQEDIDSEDKLIEQVCFKAIENDSVVCVVNTKKLALKIFEKLQKKFRKDEIYLLSTLFIPKHRKEILKTIKDRLVKKKKTILVSTQVIEAGVDLDFDFGFREFAPLYSIIQTAGRINRENRVDKRKSAKLIITNIIGNSPYNHTDLLFKEVKELLKEEIRENEILPLLKEYFEISINRTQQEPILINHMEQLNFRTAFKKFNDTFMNKIPNVIQIFIEEESGLYEEFMSEINKLTDMLKEEDITLESVMDIKSRMKDLNKSISNYVISVCKEDALSFPNFANYQEMRVCKNSFLNNENKVYSEKTGWKGLSSTLMF